MPAEWNTLYGKLKDTHRVGVGYEPSIPLILGAWGNTSDVDKQERLAEHISWAAEHAQLGEIGEYLRSLPEDAWAHLGEISLG